MTTTSRTTPPTASADDGWSSHLRRVVLVANRKGGVCKSAICRSVAAEAAAAGLKVAVVDGDPQGNVSQIDFAIEGDRGRSLAMAMQYGGDIELTVQQAGGVDVVCGGPDLQGALGAAMSSGGQIDLAANLRSALGRLCQASRYDLVLIDSGPGDTSLLDAYLRTARYLIVPTKIDEAALDGVDMVGARYVQVARDGYPIQLLGAVITLVDPRAVVRNKAVREDLIEMLGEAAQPFEATIRENKANDMDARRRGMSARDVAAESGTQNKKRLAALRAKSGIERRGSQDTWWSGRSGGDLAADYAALTREILTRIAEAEKEKA